MKLSILGTPNLKDFFEVGLADPTIKFYYWILRIGGSESSFSLFTYIKYKAYLIFSFILKVFDHENSQTIDLREVGTIVRSLGHCPSEEQVQVDR